ncbi:hypothetical protein DYBT9275_04111 [Dyadobacter sp. CECT 9275]|uniref:Secretion system C-terminal sorting domain-containing protein n=2 Tax=Dyadobacter helix TaxID=2822344 RepID=A0A916NCZ9_9BACT|nr:hypothetical protein DYBT9275_04111 [Dyadobacter sp. CECT 9275]
MQAMAQTYPVLPAPDHDADHDAIITGTISVNGSTQKVAAVVARLYREISGTPNTYVLVSSAISNSIGEFSLTGQVGETYRIEYEFPTDGFTAATGNPSSSFVATATTTAPGSGLELTKVSNTITNCGVSDPKATPWIAAGDQQSIVVDKAVATAGLEPLSVKLFTSSAVSHPKIDIGAITETTIETLDIGATVYILDPFSAGTLSTLVTYQQFISTDFGATTITVPASGTLEYWDISSGKTNSQNVPSFDPNYTGTGTITFKAAAQGKTTSTTSGGNITTTLTTNATAGVCLVYTYASNPLPVTLVSFNAKAEGNVNHLDWSTTSETNSDHFDVQRSRDGKSWSSIGKVTSQGESNELIPYTFSDRTPLSGRNYYRLKMIDRDGTFAFSRIINVKSEILQASAYVYPNPVANELFVQSDAGNDIARVQVRNLGGQVVKESVKSSESMNVSRLAPGIYTVRIIHTDGSSVNQKVLIGH